MFFHARISAKQVEFGLLDDRRIEDADDYNNNHSLIFHQPISMTSQTSTDTQTTEFPAHSIFDATAVEEFRKEHKLEPYRLKQVYDAIFKLSIIDFAEMTNLSLELRELLSENFHIIPLTVDKLIEDDETSKR